MPKGVCLNTGRTHFKKGQPSWNKGVPMSEATKHKLSVSKKGKCLGENSGMWKGGVRISRGYAYVLTRGHLAGGRDGYVRRNRLVMEKHLGRPLQRQESVHHINQDTLDDRIENLMLFPNESTHMMFHMRLSLWLQNKYPAIADEYVKTWVTTD